MVVWQKLLGLWHSEHNGTKGMPTLAEIIDQARRDWLYAQNYYNTVTDPDLIDYALFLTKAYERRYMYLLRKVRQEGLRVSMAEFIEAGTIRRML
ncbi:MAG: YaaL family protein [Sporomusa sp.]